MGLALWGAREGGSRITAGDNVPVEGDMTAQMNTIMANAAELLKAAGFGFEHVVANRVYITDGTKFGEMNKAYVPHFPKDPPTRATVIVRLPGPQYQLEITRVANDHTKEGAADTNARATSGAQDTTTEAPNQARPPRSHPPPNNRTALD